MASSALSIAASISSSAFINETPNEPVTLMCLPLPISIFKTSTPALNRSESDLAPSSSVWGNRLKTLRRHSDTIDRTLLDEI